MSFGPLQPAQIDFTDPAAPRSPRYGDVYHARAGALDQARHVFLGGNGLPGRWSGRERFAILEAGFGLGHNFLATWEAWQRDAQRCRQLWFVSIEKHPPSPDDLAHAHAGSPLRALADQLIAQWPQPTPDMHLIELEPGRVRLLLVWADIAQALSELVMNADAFYLDGFAPDRNPAMWDARRLRSLARLAAPGATLATWSVARPVRDALGAAGFIIDKAPGFATKREMSVGRFAPRFHAAAPPGRRGTTVRQVTVVGAGLAGAAAARALALQGMAVEVIERGAAAAPQASGNAGGLFHGTVHGHDGPHARWLRAAALHAQRALQPLIDAGRVSGALGLLRGEQALGIDAMRKLLSDMALPTGWVQALDAATASRLAGVPWPGPVWFYPGGGWAAPAQLAQAWLATPGVRQRFGCAVHGIRREAQRWQLLDDDGALISECEALVLANAGDAMRLLDAPPWPWRNVRGQVSIVASAATDLRLAVADSGYAIPLLDGRMLCGATWQPDDEGSELRQSDHAHNLAALQRLTGHPPPGDATALSGRVGWRMQMADRMPLVGPVPSRASQPPARADQPRFHGREPGLYVLAALGSRGLTQAALAGEVLASWISGAPMPAPASLLDALDPARFAARLNRKPAS